MTTNNEIFNFDAGPWITVRTSAGEMSGQLLAGDVDTAIAKGETIDLYHPFEFDTEGDTYAINPIMPERNVQNMITLNAKNIIYWCKRNFDEPQLRDRLTKLFSKTLDFDSGKQNGKA